MRTILAGAGVLLVLLLAGTAAAAPGAGHRAGHAMVNALDVSWLHTSLQGDKLEIVGGRMAQQHSFNPVVPALDRRLLHDHTMSYQDGAKVARQIGVVVPDEPTPTEGWELRTRSRAWGAEFDRMYTKLGVSDHNQDIEETSDEITRGWNAAVKAAARQDLPMLKLHLALSEHAKSVVSG